MIMKTEQVQGSANVGGSSILVIFVLLCITTFATLAMVSATASLRLATQVASAADAHFAADSRAEEKLARFSAAVRNLGAENLQAYVEVLGALFEDGVITYSVDITDSLRLDVRLIVIDGGILVDSWLTVPVFDPDEYGGGGVILWGGF